MTNVATTAASHPRHMLAAVIVSALLSVAAFMAISPSTAQAAQWNQINGRNVSPTPFSYTREPPNTFVRTKTDYGNITVDVTDTVTNGLCVMLLRAADGSRLALQCWLPGEYGPKPMVTAAAPQRFTIWAARRGTAYTTSNPFWDGWIYY